MGRRLAGGAWLVGLCLALFGLASVGHGALAPPPASPQEWARWASERTALEGAAALLRLAALGAVGYLLAVTTTGLGAALLRRRRAVAAVARWSPPLVRWLLGAWLAGALAAGPAAAAVASPPPTMVLLPDGEPAPPAPTTTTAPAMAPAPAAPPPAVETATATLGPGDHLWSVAARTMATARGRPPGEREVAPYWRLLVELNRSTLPNPDDPDLVFPGDVVRLPPLPR